MQDEWLSNLRNETEFLKLVDRQEMRRT